MALTLENLKNEITKNAIYSSLSDTEWEKRICDRDIHVKFDDVLKHVIPVYQQKIQGCRNELKGANESGIIIAPYNEDGSPKDAAEIINEFNSKRNQYDAIYEREQRLLDKLACCLKELQLRKNNLVVRNPHHTTYYIDYANGNDSNDGLTTGNAWKTITKYTTDTVRSPGDIALLRANTTWLQGTEAKDITFDEDGDADNWIKIIGCDSVTNDPWGDSSDVKPVIDFEYASYMLNNFQNSYWWIERIELYRGGDSEGLARVYCGSTSFGNEAIAYFKDCLFHDTNSSLVEGIRIISGAAVTLDGCEFYDCNNYAVDVVSAYAYIYNCIFNGGGVVSTNYAICTTGFVYCDSCSFGETTPLEDAAIRFESSNELVYLRNCTYSGTLHYFRDNVYEPRLYIEDDDGVYGSHKIIALQGEITKETSSPFSGGSNSYVRIAPSSSLTGVLKPFIYGDVPTGFKEVYLVKDSQYTIIVKARGNSWATEPGNSTGQGTAFLRCSYLSNASTAARTEVDSTQDLSGTNEVSFTVTFTPLQDGVARLWFYVGAYESGKYVEVDVQNVVVA